MFVSALFARSSSSAAGKDHRGTEDGRQSSQQDQPLHCQFIPTVDCGKCMKLNFVFERYRQLIINRSQHTQQIIKRSQYTQQIIKRSQHTQQITTNMKPQRCKDPNTSRQPTDEDIENTWAVNKSILQTGQENKQISTHNRSQQTKDHDKLETLTVSRS